MDDSLLEGAVVDGGGEGGDKTTEKTVTDPTVKEGEGGKVIGIPEGEGDKEKKAFDFSKASLEMFPEQFRKAENPIEEMAKSYKELQGRLTKDSQDVPKDGKYEPTLDKDIADLGVTVDMERPEFKAFLKVAQDTKMGKTAFNKAVNEYIRAEMANIPNKTEEIKKLGENGSQIINTIAKRGAEILGKDSPEFKVLASLVTTADEARVIGKILDAAAGAKREPTVPLGDTAAHDGGASTSAEEVRAMMRDPRMGSDPEFQKKTLELAAKVFGPAKK